MKSTSFHRPVMIISYGTSTDEVVTVVVTCVLGDGGGEWSVMVDLGGARKTSGRKDASRWTDYIYNSV